MDISNIDVSDIGGVEQALEKILEKFFEENQCEAKSAEDIGLDERACYGKHLMVCSYFVAVPDSCKDSMNYYGGFEYIEEEITHLGKWTIYGVYEDSDRISDCIDALRLHQQKGEEELV